MFRRHHTASHPGRPSVPLRRHLAHAIRLVKRTAPAHGKSFTPLGPDDPDVKAAFPHLAPSVLRAAQASWKVLATFIHPPGRKWMETTIARTEIPKIDVPVPGLDKAFDGYTIAFLSDIHAGPYLGSDVLIPLFKRVSRERPDLVVLGGDFVNYDAGEAAEVGHALPYLHARDGTVAVPGNHDHYTGDLARVLRSLEKAGAECLVNDATYVKRRGETLTLLGVDDGGAGRFDLARALESSRDARTRILLSHTPDALPLASRMPIDLMLSGHTHGGQVRAPKVRPLSTHTRGRYVDGFYRHGRTLAFVGRGVGVVCVPLRTFCPPHVPLLVLRAAPHPRKK
jgi:predicted MPP superfamily phosphohydrolase